jgi:hypothetical protein
MKDSQAADLLGLILWRKRNRQFLSAHFKSIYLYSQHFSSHSAAHIFRWSLSLKFGTFLCRAGPPGPGPRLSILRKQTQSSAGRNLTCESEHTQRSYASKPVLCRLRPLHGGNGGKKGGRVVGGSSVAAAGVLAIPIPGRRR